MISEFSTEQTVPLSLCDGSGCLGVTGALDMFMDAAVLHEDASGFGVYTMKEKGLYWIIGKTRLRFMRRPYLSEEIVLRTWFNDPTRLYGNREYSVEDREGKALVIGESEWLVATEGLEKLVNVKDYVKEGFYKKGCGLFDSKMKKIDKNFSEEQLLGTYTVCSEDIDFVGHMNNAAYSRAVMSFMSSEEQERRGIREAEFFYALQCREGDVLSVFRRDTEEAAEFGAFLPGGENVLTARISYER